MTDERIAQFFARMQHLYGPKWLSTYGSGLNEGGELTLSAQQWAHDLAGVADATLQHALEQLDTKFPEWPPTVPQFKALCRAPEPADEKWLATRRANDALQNVLTDAKLGILGARQADYDAVTRAALTSVGGADAVLAADYHGRLAMGSQFVRTYLRRDPLAPPPEQPAVEARPEKRLPRDSE